MCCVVVAVGKSSVTVDGGNARPFEQLKSKEYLLVERARQLLSKEEELNSLERHLRAKEEALYWRERCLRSEHLAANTTTLTPTTITPDTLSMPPLIQIQPAIVGLEPPRTVGLERRRVTLMLPDRQLQLQQMHAGKLLKQSPAKPVQTLPIYTLVVFTSTYLLTYYM